MGVEEYLINCFFFNYFALLDFIHIIVLTYTDETNRSSAIKYADSLIEFESVGRTYFDVLFYKIKTRKY